MTGLRRRGTGTGQGRASPGRARPENPRQTLGRQGEAAAAAFLAGLGYDIVGRNVRTVFGEIDLIARDGPTVVFVEVKARRGGDGLEAVDLRKQRRLSRLALHFLARSGLTEAPARFDVVAVDALTLTCTHVANAFDCAFDV